MTEQEKKMGDEAAFPVQEGMISGSTKEVPAASGLTKREYFAAMAMQGMIDATQANSTAFDFELASGQSEIARHAVSMADALLAALASQEVGNG